MFCPAELCAITRTLIACFSRRAKEPLGTSHHTRNAPHQGYLRLYQLKTRVQTVGYQNTETLLCTIKAPFFPQKEKASQLFFLIIDFIMVKWIGTCQVSQEVFSPKQPTCPPSAGAAFLASRANSPSLHMPFFPATGHEHQQPSKGTQKPAPWPRESNV